MSEPDIRDQLENHHRASFGWALCCCGRDPLEAENVLQIVYIKILEGKARYDGQSTFKTWLFSVIRRTAAEERRRRILYELRLLKYESAGGRVSPTEGPDQTLYRTEIQTMFQQALASLSARQQSVLQLVFYHDLSVRQAAEVMGLSVGSARIHYERGKKRLREWWEGVRVSHES